MAVETGTNGRVELEVSDRVAEIRLTNPGKLNAFTLELVRDLEEMTLPLEGRDDVRAVAITGEGRAFCSGAGTDVVDGPGDVDLGERYDPVLEWLINTRIPVVAGARGYAVGAGAGLLTYVPDLAFVAPRHRDLVARDRLRTPPASCHRLPLSGARLQRTTEVMLLGERAKMAAAEARELGR